MATEIGQSGADVASGGTPLKANTSAAVVVSDDSARQAPDGDRALRERLRAEPWSVRFFQMVRLLTRLHPERRPVGLFVAPKDEVLRFSAHTSLSFPASEIQTYTQPGSGTGSETGSGPGWMQVNFMGLSSLNGPLPPPYIEMLLERARAKDHATTAFFDIFNHRLVSLFYRAWQKYRFYIAYELTGGAEDAVTHSIHHLLGLGTGGLRGRLGVPDEAAVAYAGILGQQRRTAQGLKQILADYFGVPVTIEQFTGTWNRLPGGNLTVLRGGESDAECLGVGTIVGDEVWDRQGTVTVRLGPMPLAQYRSFLPGAAAHRQLASWLRLYGRDELDFVVRLVLLREEVPAMHLSYREDEMPRLGFASWLKGRPFAQDPDDAAYRMQ